MKIIKKLLFIAGVTFSVSLTACSGILNYQQTENRSTKVYSIINIDKENTPDIEALKVKSIDYKVIKGKENVPYLTIQQYASFLEPFLLDGFVSSVSDLSGALTWTISETFKTGTRTVFAAQGSVSNKYLFYSGSFSSRLTIGKDYSKSSMYVQMNYTSEIPYQGNRYKPFYYGDTDYIVFKKGGNTYYPLSLLETTFGSASDVHMLFNYNRIILFNESEDLSNNSYLVDGNESTAYEEMKSVITTKFNNEMPRDILQDRYSSFLFTMNNFYGLSDVKKIYSMENYISNLSHQFNSDNGEERTRAIYEIFTSLDDGHSGLINAGPWSSGNYSAYGPHLIEMLKTRNQLRNQRNEMEMGAGKV